MNEQTTRDFAQALILLGQHMLEHPTLSSPANAGWQGWYRDDVNGYGSGLDIQLSGDEPSELAGWARTLTDVASNARRLGIDNSSVHAYVFGRLADVPVRVWTSIPGEPFPDEPGVHEWDVTALLQEA